jgi:hypothetical protein
MFALWGVFFRGAGYYARTAPRTRPSAQSQGRLGPEAAKAFAALQSLSKRPPVQYVSTPHAPDDH